MPERVAHATANARGFEALLQAVNTQRAFVHLLGLLVEGRSAIGARRLATLAADALLLADQDGPKFGLFGYGADRTRLDTGRLLAMIAGGRKVPGFHVGKGPFLAHDDAPPAHADRKVELLLAGGLAGATADAIVLVVVPTDLIWSLSHGCPH